MNLTKVGHFHIGLTKAASTTLQLFFDKHDSIFFVNRSEFFWRLVARTSFEYSPGDAKTFVNKEISIAISKEKTPVFSHERLSGNPHSGHYDAKEIADRIHALSPKARIILCLREQMQILVSCYKQYISIGGTRSLKEYLLPVWDWRVPLFNWRFYEYHRLIRYYYDLFGPENVLILLVEELRNDPRQFYKALCDFLEVPMQESIDITLAHNPGMPDYEVERMRFLNIFKTTQMSIRDPYSFCYLPVTRWLSKHVGKFERLMRLSDQTSLLQQVRNLFAGRFVESNRIISDLISRDLKVLGYES